MTKTANKIYKKRLTNSTTYEYDAQRMYRFSNLMTNHISKVAGCSKERAKVILQTTYWANTEMPVQKKRSEHWGDVSIRGWNSNEFYKGHEFTHDGKTFVMKFVDTENWKGPTFGIQLRK